MSKYCPGKCWHWDRQAASSELVGRACCFDAETGSSILLPQPHMVCVIAWGAVLLSHWAHFPGQLHSSVNKNCQAAGRLLAGRWDPSLGQAGSAAWNKTGWCAGCSQMCLSFDFLSYISYPEKEHKKRSNLSQNSLYPSAWQEGGID